MFNWFKKMPLAEKLRQKELKRDKKLVDTLLKKIYSWCKIDSSINHQSYCKIYLKGSSFLGYSGEHAKFFINNFEKCFRPELESQGFQIFFKRTDGTLVDEIKEADDVVIVWN